MDFKQQTIAEFENAGAEQVRLKVAAGLIGPAQVQFALDWLREKEAEAARQAEAERDQAARIAKVEKKALAKSNATIITIAGLTLIATLLAWLFPRH